MNGYVIHQTDVKTAFLNGHLEEEIYMCQPPGYIERGKEQLVCRVKKSLHGLKHPPLCWNKVIDEFLRTLRFVRTASDLGVYRISMGQDEVHIGLYVG